MKVDGVWHDGGAEHRGGEQDALGAVEPWHQTACDVAEWWWLDHQARQESDGDDEEQPGDDPFEGSLPAPVLHGEKSQGYDTGDDAADEQWELEDQVQGDRATDDLGEIGCDGYQFSLEP